MVKRILLFVGVVLFFACEMQAPRRKAAAVESSLWEPLKESPFILKLEELACGASGAPFERFKKYRNAFKGRHVVVFDEYALDCDIKDSLHTEWDQTIINRNYVHFCKERRGHYPFFIISAYAFDHDVLRDGTSKPLSLERMLDPFFRTNRYPCSLFGFDRNKEMTFVLLCDHHDGRYNDAVRALYAELSNPKYGMDFKALLLAENTSAEAERIVGLRDQQIKEYKPRTNCFEPGVGGGAGGPAHDDSEGEEADSADEVTEPSGKKSKS